MKLGFFPLYLCETFPGAGTRDVPLFVDVGGMNVLTPKFGT